MIEILKDLVQGSPEWFAARAGLPTASEFSTVLAKGRSGGPSVTRRKYMLTLMGERITGKTIEGYTNAHMERGKEMEDQARATYEFLHDIKVERVGFIKNGSAGASPDGLVMDIGMVEIKTMLPHILLECLLQDKVPTEHIDQLQGQLWVAERQFVDFVGFWPGMKPFVKRLFRDEQRIAEIKIGVQIFNAELDDLLKQYGAMA